LRKQFEPFGKDVAGAIIPRFKERKLIEEIHTALENMINFCTNLADIVFEVKAGLVDKAPSTKKNTANFLEKAIAVTYIDVLEGTLDEVVPKLIENANDSNGEVRDAALNCLGILKGRCSEKMDNYLRDFKNPQKLEKITQVSGEVKPSKYDKPEKQVVVPKKKAPPAKQPSGAAKKGTKVKKDVEEEEKGESGGFSNPVDEMPIGGGSKKDPFADAYPPGMSEEDMIGSRGGGFDDQPIGGGKKKDPFEGAYPEGMDPMDID